MDDYLYEEELEYELTEEASSEGTSYDTDDNSELELSEEVVSSSFSSASSLEEIDYSSLLMSLLDSQDQASNYSSYMVSAYENYQDNNDLTSDINSISLTNMLLYLVFVAILGSCALNFSRRIL